MMPVLPLRPSLKPFRLGVVLVICLQAPLSAQTEEREPLKALIEIRGENIVEHTPFTLSILVNHPRPDEITVEPPDFHDEFFLERLRSKIRVMRPVSNTRRPLQAPDDTGHIWTELELLIVPAAAGEFTLSAFAISSPVEHVNTLPVQLRVMPGKEDVYLPLLAWKGAPSVRVGEEGSAALTVTNYKPGAPLPDNFAAAVQAPPNAIIDTLPLSASDKNAGILLRLLVRPLDGANIQIAAFSVPYREYYLTVPALNFKVLPPLAKASGGSAVQAGLPVEQDGAHDGERPSGAPAVPFPDDGLIPGMIAFFDGARLRELSAEAKRRWLDGDYAAALALLRAGERDFAAGPYLARMRRAAEAGLGLPLEKNEAWLPARIFALLGAAGLAGVLITAARYLFTRLYLKKRGKPGIKRLCAAAALALLGGAGCISNTAAVHRNAVLRTCGAYNVPETAQQHTALFAEGTPVTVSTQTENWLYVEASNGSSGWITRESAVFY